MEASAKMNMWLHKAVLARIAENGGNVPKGCSTKRLTKQNNERRISGESAGHLASGNGLFIDYFGCRGTQQWGGGARMGRPYT